MANESIEIWRRIARWWDEKIGEGNEFQTQLIMPATDRLLGEVNGLRVLDVACGNGNYSRRLAKAGALVVGIDVAEGFIEAAKEKGGGAEYRVVDATDLAALLAVGKAGEFDAAVCSMALMDLPVIEPLLGALAVLLKKGGRFVFSIPHPCFNSHGAKMTAELVADGKGGMEQRFGVEVMGYATATEGLSVGIVNQPEAHWIYHRPLSELVRAFGEWGFVLDGLEEPVFEGRGSGKNAFSWKARPEIPPALVARVKRVI